MSVNIVEENGRKFFYVDVGGMTTEEAMEYLNQIKKEYVNERRTET